MAQEKRPDKKVYSITEAGLEALLGALMAPPARDKVRSDFLFILFFAQMLDVPRLAALVDQRIAWYRDCLERMEACDLKSACHPGEVFVHGLGRALYEAAAAYLAEHRERLLEGRSGRAPGWSPNDRPGSERGPFQGKQAGRDAVSRANVPNSVVEARSGHISLRESWRWRRPDGWPRVKWATAASPRPAASRRPIYP